MCMLNVIYKKYLVDVFFFVNVGVDDKNLFKNVIRVNFNINLKLCRVLKWGVSYLFNDL